MNYSASIKILDNLIQQKYEIISNRIEKQQNMPQFQVSLKEKLSIINYQGIRKIDGKAVDIQFSNNNINGYHLLKNEYQIYSKHQIFPSFLAYVDHFDFENEDIFILITDSYQSTLNEILTKNRNESMSVAIQDNVNSIFSLLNCLFEFHSNQVIHYNININTIAITSDGSYKFKDPISNIDILKELYNEKLSQEDVLYQPLEIKKQYIDHLIIENDDFILLKSLDVYSLGLVFLRMIGLEINDETIQMIEHEQYQDLQSMIESDYSDIFGFIRDFMINKNPMLRYTSLQLIRNFLKFYDGQYLDKQSQVRRLQNLQESFISLNYESNLYKMYLNCLIVSMNKSQQKQQKIDLINEVKQYLSDHPQNTHNLYQEIGISYYQVDDFNSALESCQASLNLRKTVYQQNHQLIIESQRDIGICFRYIGNIEKSLEFLKSSEELGRLLFKGNHEAISHSLKEIAYVYQDKEEFDISSGQLQEALQLRESLYSPNHYLRISILLDQSENLSQQNRFEEQLQVILKVRELIKNNYRDNCQMQLTSLQDLVNCYINLQQYENALEIQIQGLQIAKINFDKSDSFSIKQFTSFLTGTAQCNQYLQNFDQSINQFTQALTILNENNQNNLFLNELAILLSNFINLYNEMGNFEEEYNYWIQYLLIKHVQQKEPLNLNETFRFSQCMMKKENNVQIQVFKWAIKKSLHLLKTGNYFITYMMENLRDLVEDQESQEFYEININNNQKKYDF